MLVVCGALLCRLHASCTLELYARLYVPAVPIVCGCYAAATANPTAVDILQVEIKLSFKFSLASRGSWGIFTVFYAKI